MTKILSFLQDESGATAIEYGVILGLVVLAIVGALKSLQGSVQNMYSYVVTEVVAAISG